jgi:hypothetical protein
MMPASPIPAGIALLTFFVFLVPGLALVDDGISDGDLGQYPVDETRGL